MRHAVSEIRAEKLAQELKDPDRGSRLSNAGECTGRTQAFRPPSSNARRRKRAGWPTSSNRTTQHESAASPVLGATLSDAECSEALRRPRGRGGRDAALASYDEPSQGEYHGHGSYDSGIIASPSIPPAAPMAMPGRYCGGKSRTASHCPAPSQSLSLAVRPTPPAT